MQVMVLEQDQAFQARIAAALMEKGFHVICVETIAAAQTFIRLDFIDVLVFGERIGGRLSHAVALLGECRNPLLAAVLLTDRTGPDVDEVFDLMPCVTAILGRKVAPAVVAQVVLSAAGSASSETARQRLTSRWSAAESMAALEETSAEPAPATSLPVPGMTEERPPERSSLPILILSASEHGVRWPADTDRMPKVLDETDGWDQDGQEPIFSATDHDMTDFDAFPLGEVVLGDRRLHLA